MKWIAGVLMVLLTGCAMAKEEVRCRKNPEGWATFTIRGTADGVVIECQE